MSGDKITLGLIRRLRKDVEVNDLASAQAFERLRGQNSFMIELLGVLGDDLREMRRELRRIVQVIDSERAHGDDPIDYGQLP